MDYTTIVKNRLDRLDEEREEREESLKKVQTLFYKLEGYSDLEKDFNHILIKMTDIVKQYHVKRWYIA